MQKTTSDKRGSGLAASGNVDDIDISGMAFIDTTVEPSPSSRNEEVEFSGSGQEIMPENTGMVPTQKNKMQRTGAAGGDDYGQRVRIGDRLVSQGVITTDQLNVALHEKKISGKMLGEVLVSLGFITPDMLTAFLSESSGFEVFNPKVTVIDANALSLFEKKIAVKHQILPVSINNGIAQIAMADPYDVVAMDALRRYLPKGVTIKPMVTTPTVLNEAIGAAYGHASKVSDILKELERSDKSAIEDVSGLREENSFTHPIVRLVNALISEAVTLKASDLHFEPEENFVRLRYRIDGDLMTAQILHKQHWNAVGQRIKIMSNLNIADKLAPQDGRINMFVGGKEIDFRVSTLPTVHGENIVMRVLDKGAGIKPLGSLGFSEENLKKIRRAQAKPEGIIIVTGPTGSGKTTSLYSMLNEINTVDVNIQTMEDPVEYSLPMVRQTAIKEGILDFADGIRALMRQDPNIIFIGEVRDGITAGMALKAAMTGHQVYTTLHTNDSFAALPRLYDLGMVPGMIAGNVVAIFAQRLVRTLCTSCKEACTATKEECEIMELDPENPPRIYRARQGGCESCGGIGYKGRIAVAEILLFDEDLDEVVARGGTRIELKNVAAAKGFKGMREDGFLKIQDGITTLEALAKVVSIYK